MEGEEEETEERMEALRLNDAWRRPSEFSSSETVSRNGSRSSSLDGRTRGGDMAIPRARHVVERKPERRREQQLVSARESELEDEE